LYNDLNKRHFEDGQKLNDRKMLIEAASKAGVDPAVAEAFLASGEGENEIEGALHILRRMGINSIPNSFPPEFFSSFGNQSISFARESRHPLAAV